MKPEWKDAPEWAKYLAMDEDGRWWWYELEPFGGQHGWFDGKFAMQTKAKVKTTNHWHETLEERPAT
jgi:hypothetical protein